MLATATDAAMKQGAHAGNLIKAIAKLVGGGGGGRPNMAQAGGKNPAGIEDAIASKRLQKVALEQNSLHKSLYCQFAKFWNFFQI